MATSRLSTRRVEWRVQVGTSNKPGQGLVIFEASVSYIPDPLAAGGPRTAIPEPVAAVLDAGGYACTPDPANPAKAGERSVELFTTDSLGADGGDWTWTARPQLRSVNGIQMAGAIPAFSFAVPTGTGNLDLAKVQKVPASPGLGEDQAVALLAQYQRDVDGVVARANAGEFKGDRGLPGINAVPAADAVSAYASTPGNPVNQSIRALAAAERPLRDLRPKATDRVYLAHRGSTLYPENSMEAFRACADAGFAIELDIQELQDGSLAVCHDETTGRSMTGPGAPLKSLTREEFLNRRIRPTIPGGKEGRPVLLEQVLDEIGGRVLLLIELKYTAAENGVVPSQRTQRVCEAIINRGLQKSVMAGSFNYWQATLEVAAAGVTAVQFAGNNFQTPTVMYQRGIRYITASMDATPAEIKAFLDAGLIVWAWTVNTKADAERCYAMGCTGITTDDPWALSGRYSPVQREAFTGGYLWPYGGRTYGEQIRLEPFTPGLEFIYKEGSNVTPSQRLGQFGFGKAVGRYRFEVQHKAGASDTSRWIGVYIGKTSTDGAFLENDPLADGYHFLVRRNGSKDIYRAIGTTSTQIAAHISDKSAGWPPREVGNTGTKAEFEIEISTTEVILRCLTDSTEVRVPDTGYRGSDAIISVRASSNNAILSNFRVAR